MTSKKKFFSSKGDDCELDSWDDLAVIKIYDISISDNPQDFVADEAEEVAEETESQETNEEQYNGNVGEMVWSRTPGVEIHDESQLTDSTSSKKRRNRGSRKSNKKKGHHARTNEVPQWKEGDSCMVHYAQDGLYYRATVKEVCLEEGTVIVTHDGLDEDEEFALDNIYPESLWTDAGINLNAGESMSPYTEDISHHETSYRRKKVNPRKAKYSYNPSAFHHTNIGDFTVPPPPQFPFSDAPLPPPFPSGYSDMNLANECKESLSSMLVSWYMAGYHTGYYRGVRWSATSSQQPQRHRKQFKTHQ